MLPVGNVWIQQIKNQYRFLDFFHKKKSTSKQQLPAIAQLVERSTVDRLVTCSNQVGGRSILRTKVLIMCQ